MSTNKPLFIPLKTEFYKAFCDGSKRTEYRMYGARWNEQTCRVVRTVVISKGYGKHARRSGVITAFEKSRKPTWTKEFRDCYGHDVLTCYAACITIELTPEPKD